MTYLVADNRLFDSCQVLEGRENDVTPLRAANIFSKPAELFAQGDQDLVFIFNRFCTSMLEGGGLKSQNVEVVRLTVEKRNKLFAGTLGAEGQSNRREAVDGIES